MSISNVHSRFVSGKQEFYDPATDQVVLRLDGPGKTADVPSGANLYVAGAVNPVVASFYCTGTPAATDQAFFLAPRGYKVLGITEFHGVAAGGTLTLEVMKDTGTTAAGGGTTLHNTATSFDLNGTANTLQTATLTATAATLTLAAGDRLSVHYTGSIASTAGVVVSVSMYPV